MIRIMTAAVFVFAMAFAATPTAATTDWQPFDQKAFDMAVASGKGVVLHYHADWCPICKAQVGLLADVIKGDMAMKKNVFAYRANFDTETMLKKKHGVEKQSTIIVFKAGKEVARSTGVTDRAALAELIAKAS